MPQAARLGDPIGHSPTMSWLVTGALVAGAIAGTAVAIVGTGGLAAVAIMGGALAGGAGIGEALSTMSFAPKEVCGTIVGVCSSNVFTNGRPAARAHVDMTFCAKHPQVPLPIATGSASVFINGLPAARVDDTIACSAVITDGSGNVFIGGATVKTDVISPENLVPPAVHTAMLVVGVASAVILAGPVVAVVGLGLGMGGGMLGGFVGGKVFGEGSDGQKWSAFGGSVIGGMLGGKIGTGIVNKAIPSPITPGMGFIKGGLPGMQAAEAAGSEAAASAFKKPLVPVKAPA
ncbi:PAAR domain-containing protein, partial [Massilia sp. P8910]|uniref:PAAR domain-containing protein n=1 Tax=Massilia antarctica TaxID=2765360 RepID=UPI001E430F49